MKYRGVLLASHISTTEVDRIVNQIMNPSSDKLEYVTAKNDLDTIYLEYDRDAGNAKVRDLINYYPTQPMDMFKMPYQLEPQNQSEAGLLDELLYNGYPEDLAMDEVCKKRNSSMMRELTKEYEVSFLGSSPLGSYDLTSPYKQELSKSIVNVGEHPDGDLEGEILHETQRRVDNLTEASMGGYYLDNQAKLNTTPFEGINLPYNVTQEEAYELILVTEGHSSVSLPFTKTVVGHHETSFMNKLIAEGWPKDEAIAEIVSRRPLELIERLLHNVGRYDINPEDVANDPDMRINNVPTKMEEFFDKQHQVLKRKGLFKVREFMDDNQITQPGIINLTQYLAPSNFKENKWMREYENEGISEEEALNNVLEARTTDELTSMLNKDGLGFVDVHKLSLDNDYEVDLGYYYEQELDGADNVDTTTVHAKVKSASTIWAEIATYANVANEPTNDEEFDILIEMVNDGFTKKNAMYFIRTEIRDMDYKYQLSMESGVDLLPEFNIADRVKTIPLESTQHKYLRSRWLTQKIVDNVSIIRADQDSTYIIGEVCEGLTSHPMIEELAVYEASLFMEMNEFIN